MLLKGLAAIVFGVRGNKGTVRHDSVLLETGATLLLLMCRRTYLLLWTVNRASTVHVRSSPRICRPLSSEALCFPELFKCWLALNM